MFLVFSLFFPTHLLYFVPFVSFLGQDSLLKFIQIVQEECDRRASIIFMNYMEQRSVSSILQRVRRELSISNRSVSTSDSLATVSQQKPSPIYDYCLTNEALISELALFNARIELYLNFLRRRLWVISSVSITIICTGTKQSRRMISSQSCQR